MSILCINCRHYRAPESKGLSPEQYAKCHHPRFISMVTGHLDARTCAVQRDVRAEGYCGPEAKFFEAAVEPKEAA